ncbi:MAG TPA: hypothetical protein DEQ40_13805 [Oxalobacteraceae bacterium]|jgi:hypothetical protein|nr:hypothetical protein [Oxalobacteraceae bacterium]
MENKQVWHEFTVELERRFGELERWALQHWPDQDRPLSTSDFSPLRYELSLISNRLKNEDQRGPEPSEGGPQYINMNPEPWP